LTDLLKLAGVLDSFGISPSIESYPLNNKIVLSLEGHVGGVKGYSGFYCVFTFDLMGMMLMRITGNGSVCPHG
jgi:hypothetical protein